MKVAVIDLFCGMGGFSQGALDAGAEVVLAVDNWEYAVAVHRENHPDVRIWKMELGHESHWKLFLRIVREYQSKGYHVHIHGSPPCQALSNASSRDASEGMPLVLWFLDLVERCEPDSWSMENVVPVRKRLPEGTPSVVLNAADYGVAQTRRRCYAGDGWVAQPTHSKDEWLGVIDVLPELADIEGYAPPPSMTEHFKHKKIDSPFPMVTSQSPLQLRLLMDSGRSSSKTSGVNPRTGKKEGGSGPLYRSLDGPSYTIMTSARKLCLNTAGGGRSSSRRVTSAERDVSEPSKTIANNQPSIRSLKLEALGSNAKRQADRSINEPSKTVCGSGNQVGPRVFDHTDDKPVKIRSLTIPETLILQGFSPDFKLTTAKTQKNRWTMIGNAVPPPVAEAVIKGIIHNGENRL